MKTSTTSVTYIVNETLILTDAVNGKASLSVPMTMSLGKYYYDLEWTDSG